MNFEDASASLLEPVAAKPSVWIVDDSPVELEIVRRALDASYAVTCFADGAEMIERLQTARPDALVIDWQMPVLSGLEICRFVRTSFGITDLPIVIVTATRHRQDVVEGLRSGANDYVMKPFDREELSARLASLIERSHLQRELREHAAFRERFMAILGHDLRQPLTTIVLGARVLAGRDHEAIDARTITMIGRASARMQRMIDDLLDLTRTRSGGGIPIVPAQADLADVCRSAVDEIRAGHPDRAIEWRGPSRCHGAWDRDRITQLLGNLISNALEHGDPHGIVSVQLMCGEEVATLSVQNTGEPISKASAALLFDPFRGARQGSRGLGLGLFIAEQIARRHGGSIAVKSDVEHTRFTVTLPREGLRETPTS